MGVRERNPLPDREPFRIPIHSRLSVGVCIARYESRYMYRLFGTLVWLLVRVVGVGQSVYRTSSIHCEHTQELPAPSPTSVHTSASQTCAFVHTGGVDTCIVYMYRLAFRTLYKPSAAAVTALMHHTHPSCTPALAATATFARGQHENTQKQLPTHVDAGAKIEDAHTVCTVRAWFRRTQGPVEANSLAVCVT